jgi:sugar phosphate permease
VLFVYWIVADYPDGNSVQSFPTRPPEPAEKSPGNRNRLIVILLSTIFLASADRLEWAMILIVSVGFFEQLIAPLFFALELDLLPPELAGTGAGFLEAGGHLGSMCAIFFSGLLVDVFGSYKPVFWF